MIGAGPAGLTAAYELLTRTAWRPVVLEASERVGGISTTVRYKGYRIDLGGHRFFSKSDRVMQWWLSVLPLQGGLPEESQLRYQGKSRSLANNGEGPDPEQVDRVMLVRQRRSSIYFEGRRFPYPLRLTPNLLNALGLARTIRMGVSYLRALARPVRPEKSLEDFLVNRFGRELYRTFFEEYTYKVWGVPCSELSASWGAQRIKRLSALETVLHGLGLSRKNHTSLIEQFLYPKYGPGQMWEETAARVVELGGEVLTGWRVEGIHHDGHGRVTSVAAVSTHGERREFAGDVFLSTMPVKELVGGLRPAAEEEAVRVAEGLPYRAFVTVGLLCGKLAPASSGMDENWIYIQEPGVKLGRVQVFNNWSPYLVADRSKTWLGLEYFCDEGDEFWRLRDEEVVAFAKREAARIGIAREADIEDGMVIRVPKAYPAYRGTYEEFGSLRAYLDQFDNLFLLGRNGMHRYNNQDHSMLAAMTLVDQLAAGRVDREALWGLNSEPDYIEER